MKRYQLQYLRLGFANNSSSSHSVIIVDPKYKGIDNGPDSDNYGWEHFLCATKEAKKDYVKAQIKAAFEEPLASLICGQIFNEPLSEKGIDHQSIWNLPIGRDGARNIEYFKEMVKQILEDDNIAIEGGNDNGDDDIVYGKRRMDKAPHGTCVRKEKNGVWTFFSKVDGTKVRLSPEFQGLEKNRKADTPELVDVKITDYCNAGCSFCYQNSSPKGKHADYNDFVRLMETLDKLNVFEVVLGGGEPTSHPRFADMLKVAHDHNMVPNFTTRTTDWVQDEKIRKSVTDYVGSIALSCNNFTDLLPKLQLVEKVMGKEDRYNLAYKIIPQFIVGITPIEQIAGCMKELTKRAREDELGYHRSLSLVGFKPAGRAKDIKPLPVGNVEEALDKVVYRMSVDTALLKQCPELKAGRDLEIETKEGLNSLYIDLVEKTMCESSYTGKAVPVNVDDHEAINKYFESL